MPGWAATLTDRAGILTPATLTRAIIAELDGYEFHEEAFESGRAKDADLVEAGHRVVRVTWDRLMEQPRREAARFRTLLA